MWLWATPIEPLWSYNPKDRRNDILYVSVADCDGYGALHREDHNLYTVGRVRSFRGCGRLLGGPGHDGSGLLSRLLRMLLPVHPAAEHWGRPRQERWQTSSGPWLPLPVTEGISPRENKYWSEFFALWWERTVLDPFIHSRLLSIFLDYSFIFCPIYCQVNVSCTDTAMRHFKSFDSEENCWSLKNVQTFLPFLNCYLGDTK